MTDKEVMQMAREAGWYAQQMPVEQFFERFAALVAEATKEKLLKSEFVNSQGTVMNLGSNWRIKE